MLELVLGGARSGKSTYAEQQAKASGLDVIYIATAQADDAEMAHRIRQHQSQRPSHWKTSETPIALASTLTEQARSSRCLLVDCLTLWLSNCLLHDDIECWPQQRQCLLDVLPNLPGTIILVSNEVGQGIVPMGEINRRFVDEAGWLHQSLAEIAARVTLLTAGLPQYLKGK
jgi:adenosylcobinamide kinase/adenosylcobinamide-phosphate guanylyltransferase